MKNYRIYFIILMLLYLGGGFLLYLNKNPHTFGEKFDANTWRKQSLQTVKLALEAYKKENNHYPLESEDSANGKVIWAGPESIVRQYLSDFAPMDPVNVPPYVLSYITPDPSKVTDQPGDSYQLKAHLSTGQDYIVSSE
jgi:type II secretory pathway pseudopilin PulG